MLLIKSKGSKGHRQGVGLAAQLPRALGTGGISEPPRLPTPWHQPYGPAFLISQTLAKVAKKQATVKGAL